MNSRAIRAFPPRGGRVIILAALAVAAVCLATSPAAATIRVELTFEAPTITRNSDGSVFVAASECLTFNEPGLPLLPARRAVVLLPPGESVTAIRVLAEGLREIPGAYLVAHAQEPQPIGIPGPYPLTEPDPRVYRSDEAYPSEAARLVTEQKGWGHGLAFLRVFPVAYRPLSGVLSWYERVVVEVDTALPKGGNADLIPRLRKSGRALDRLSGLVVNPQDLALYEKARPAPLTESLLDPDYYPYVIVTRDKFKEAFKPVAEFESSRGLRARIMTVEEIRDAYPDGRDVPESIRMFLIDAYENWGTEYVLLGGDAEVVKPRIITDCRIPADCYFEGLDGDWNGDGDTWWGEAGEEDLVGEIAVGRASIDMGTEIDNWLHKNRMYTEQPVVSQIRKALFLGEALDDITWGGDAMDEVKDGADTCGYTTVGYPADYQTSTLYDRDWIWEKEDVLPLINAGFPAVHHLGHSSPIWNMKMLPTDIELMTNDGVNASYMFYYTQGCLAGWFNSKFMEFKDSFCEVLVNDENGAAASVCNAFSGFYNPGTTCGPSQHYHRQFVDARYGEGIITAGRMNVDSKADLVWMMDEWNRYIHLGTNLFGDPAIPQWGDVLGELALQHAGRYVIGQGDYPVAVTANGVPVPGATVTLYSSDLSVWTSGETDEYGVVMLNPGDIERTTLYLKAVKADYLPAADNVQVTPN